ncbi:MAG: arsenate reductase ArsC [Candidatus Kapabacteria bacterium]|nr:arsenate reductase ArsC [Candidatus Kapabacteria bacterium]
MNILFVCTGNSCRSQMAEGWARHLLSHQCVAYSAGITAKGLDPRAIEAMRRAGVDISRQRSQPIDQLPNIAFDIVVTVCDNARESCPVIPGVAVSIHRSFDDPPHLAQGMTDDQAMIVYGRVRDQIRDFVQAMPAYFDKLAEAERS